jgi:GNAT superfamily N-acetyltransferase
MNDDLAISEWDDAHPRWSEALAFLEEYSDGLPDPIPGYDQRDSRYLVATFKGDIVGELRLIVIPIGPENDLPAVKVDGQELLQAKVMEFVVLPQFRRRGIGTKLQESAMTLARSLGCYQLASFIYSGNAANHMLKLSMGFAVRPESRGDEAHGLYFIMPLRPDALPPEPPADRHG